MRFQLFKSAFRSFFIGVAFLMTSLSANAFTEGTDYMVLETPIPNAQGTIIKVFSYDCPFCYRYDKSVIVPLMANLGDSLRFVPFHLETKGVYGRQASELFAVLIVRDMDNGTSLLADNSLFKTAKMAYYQAYHDRQERWDGGANDFLQTGLDAVGMTMAEFEQAKQDPRVQELLNNWQIAYEVAKIQGVPAFVVNGQYLIYTKNIRSIESMADLVRELAAK